MGDTVVLEATGDRLRSDVNLAVLVGGVEYQRLKIHTSCSKPLDVGDVFGSLELSKFYPESVRPGTMAAATVTSDSPGALVRVAGLLRHGLQSLYSLAAIFAPSIAIADEGGTPGIGASGAMGTRGPDFCAANSGASPGALLFTYEGFDCTGECNDQGPGSVVVTGNTNGLDTVYIVVTDGHASEKVLRYISGNVSL